MNRGPTDVMNVERDAYTWESAVKDLALMTHLTLEGAFNLTSPLRSTDLHPYDVLQWLIALVDASAKPDRDGTRTFGIALKGLITRVPYPSTDVEWMEFESDAVDRG